ncbi:hypothetical protein RhiJN_05589 [Ceratobasidium sp. AG-Ba]|nr:hypothetical protein RhiJN_05589 [Ceratobasidium sp. AG-Ba]
MSWFGKKKSDSDDGDFPTPAKHYREETAPTRLVSIAPPLPWNGVNSVIWAIDIGVGTTTMSFAYLRGGYPVEVHNITYWPKEFPIRESAGSPFPDPKAIKAFKTREMYTSVGFVSHPSWSSEKIAKYLYTTHHLSSPPAFQVRTEVPAVESPERYKFNDLVEHLLKHALGIYGAVIKPTQSSWPQASDVVITLPSGLPKSAEMTITGELDRIVNKTMPKVIGQTRTFYVRKPDVRLFEDELWRNIDTNFHDGDVFLLVDWDMISGDMLCASYKAIRLNSGHMSYGLRLRSYMQALPSVGKRDATVDEREGVRFASALYWCAENKHCTQKLIVRISSPIKKPENLLAFFHKTLVDKNLQVGLRSMDPATETKALGAAVWRIAHALAQSQNPDGDRLSLVPDMTQVLSKDVNINAREPQPSSELEASPRMSHVDSSSSANLLRRTNRQSGSSPSALDKPEQSLAPFTSTPLDWVPGPVANHTPVEGTAHMATSLPGPPQPIVYNYAGPASSSLPPAYVPEPGKWVGYSNDQAIAGWEYRAAEDNEISLAAGELVVNIDKVDRGATIP